MKSKKILAVAIILVAILIGVFFGFQAYCASLFVTDGHGYSPFVAIVNICPENITVENVGDLNVTLESFYVNNVLDSEAVFSKTTLALLENATIIPSKKLDMQYGLKLEARIKEKSLFTTWLRPSIHVMNFTAECVTVENIGYLNVTLTNFYVNHVLDSGAVFSKTELAPSEVATIIPSIKLDMNKWFGLRIETIEGGFTEAWNTPLPYIP
jgi:hypothetical protein